VNRRVQLSPRLLALAASLSGRDADEDELEILAALATWSCLVEPGDGIAGRAVRALGPVAALQLLLAPTQDSDALHAADITRAQWRAAAARWRPRLDSAVVERALDTADRAGVRLLVPFDDRWPAALDDLGEFAPLCLWVRGDPGTLGRRPCAVAIVGARAATGYGEHVAAEMAAELAGRGVAVVSGGAYGIDGAAHRAALSGGGTTIAFLAGGADRPYPAGHTDLLARIAASGAVVSEVPCGGAPTRWRFLQRNRCIAALADATVVVEAGWRSGSLNTAHHTLSLGRPLGVVPGPVTSAASAGCHRLLREEDARCVTGPDDVMELLGVPAGEPAARGAEPSAPRTDDRTRVLDALSVRSRRDTLDIARRAGMSPDDVEAHLGLLQLEGGVAGDARGWVRVGAETRTPPDSR
jgi:DNA processing protein